VLNYVLQLANHQRPSTGFQALKACERGDQSGRDLPVEAVDLEHTLAQEAVAAPARVVKAQRVARGEAVDQ
jgi:hypothetical protein